MEYQEANDKDLVVLSLKGPFLAEPDAVKLRQHFRELVEQRVKHVVIDMGAVTHINSCGLGDIQIEPLLLGWHKKQADFAVGYSLWAPTGDDEEMGNGFWSHMFTAGVTWYPDEAKTWPASVLNRYEIHTEKDNVTPGDTFTLEFGVAKTLKPGMDLGVVGYWQEQVTNGSNDSSPGRGQRVAVIGPTADDPLALLCGYSFPVHLIPNDAGEAAAQVVTPRAALEHVFGAERVAYARGCFIIEERKYGSPVFPGDVEKSTTLEQVSPVSRRTDLIPAAVACAQAADVAVVCVGDLAGLFNTGTVGEGSDADSLDLPGVQQQLLEAVVATGKPVVVVLTSGRPYNLGGLEEKVAAFVMAFAGGQEGGPALVDVLTGTVEPSGRLSVSVPKNVGAVPYYYNHKMKSAGTVVSQVSR